MKTRETLSISEIAEIISASAVVVSLIFVRMGLSQNTLMQRVIAAQALVTDCERASGPLAYAAARHAFMPVESTAWIISTMPIGRS